MGASLSGKMVFTPEAQMHLDITESTVSVERVTREVQQRQGKQYRIVTADGLELEDCEGKCMNEQQHRYCYFGQTMHAYNWFLFAIDVINQLPEILFDAAFLLRYGAEILEVS